VSSHLLLAMMFPVPGSPVWQRVRHGVDQAARGFVQHAASCAGLGSSPTSSGPCADQAAALAACMTIP
jgi:hypothetical protein